MRKNAQFSVSVFAVLCLLFCFTAAADDSMNTITDLKLEADEASLIVTIKGEHPLIYRALKKQSSVIFYFPDTTTGSLEPEYIIDSDIATTIYASELTDNNGTAKVEITFKRDIVYEINRDGKELEIVFSPLIKKKE